MEFGKHEIDFTIKVNHSTKAKTENADIIFQGGPFSGKQSSIIIKPDTAFRIAVVARVENRELAAKMQLKLGIVQTVTSSQIHASYDDVGDKNDYYETIDSNTRDGGTDHQFPWYSNKQIDLGLSDNPPELVVTDQPTIEVPRTHKIFGTLQSASSEQNFSSYLVLQELEQQAMRYLFVFRVLWRNELFGRGNPIVLDDTLCGMSVISQSFLSKEEAGRQPEDVELIEGPANSVMNRRIIQRSQFGGKPSIIEYEKN